MIRVVVEAQESRPYFSIWVYNEADGTCAKPAEIEFVKAEDAGLGGVIKPEPTFQIPHELWREVSKLGSRATEKEVRAEVAIIRDEIAKAITGVLQARRKADG